MNKIVEKVKYKYLFLATSIILLIPSLIYLLQNKSVINFKGYFTFFLQIPRNYTEAMLGAIIFGIILVLFIYYYFKILKNDDKEFKNIKQIIFYVLIISIVFGVILPFTSSDVYYYISTGWMDAHYNENPYYTAPYEVRIEHPEDEILQKTGVWEKRVVVYGPIWVLICKMLSFFSFGSVTSALYIYKIAAIATHILNTVLVYKITGKKKLAICYGLNIFILFEMITNVHNDIYMITFILLALYALLKKKNIILTIIFMALATCIKYVALLLIPFLVLYYLKDKTIPKKILYCFLYAILFIGITILIYLMYIKDYTAVSVIQILQGSYGGTIQGILLTISRKIGINLLKYGKIIFTTIFIMSFIDALIFMFVSKKNSFRKIIKRYNNLILIFTFLMLTNAYPWYVSWLVPTMFWLKGKSLKNILYLQFSYELVTLINFALFSESYKIALFYIPIIICLIIIFNLIEKINKENILKLREVKDGE